MTSTPTGAVVSSKVGTVLVSDRTAPIEPTANCETDTRTALTRGLSEYLSQIKIQMPGGRELRLKRVIENWSEPEDVATYPSALVYSTEAGEYDASRFTPGLNKDYRLAAPDGRYFVVLAEMVLNLVVDVWATDPRERMGLAKMLEDAFNPCDWMYGFRLDLPHYYNARSSYSLKSISYVDDSDDAMKRYRRLIFTLQGNIPLMKLVAYPDARFQHKLTVTDDPQISLADDC